MAFTPTEAQNASNKHVLWTTLDRVVEEVPRHEHMFVLMYVNARAGRRGKGGVGSKDDKILDAYGRDTLHDKGELLLFFANNHDLTVVNTFFSTPKGGVSHTFNGRGKKTYRLHPYETTWSQTRTERYGAPLAFLPFHFVPQHCIPTRQAPWPFCSKPPVEGLS